jgi:hypothetical protein
VIVIASSAAADPAIWKVRRPSTSAIGKAISRNSPAAFAVVCTLAMPSEVIAISLAAVLSPAMTFTV